VAILHKSLVKHGFKAGALHGDMDQKSRTDTLDRFRSGELMLLAASDVAARGLDIPDVSHIFNYDLPWQPDDYVHRIGRTGRAGKEGCSTSLVTPDELKSLKDIEKMLGAPVVWIGEPPTEQDYQEAGKRRRRGGRGAPRGRSAAPPARAHGKGRSSRPPERKEARGERPDRRPEQPQPRHEPRIQEQPRQEQPRQEPRRQEPRRQEPRRPEKQPHRHAGEAPHGQPAQPRPERARERQPEASRSGFADNVPAFLRKPLKRPVKVAGE
jgi:superfamily II DNA/RNA helicase